MMIPGFVTIIVIEVSYVWQKKNLFGPKCHGCVFFCSACSFASQRIHLKGDVNNNSSCYPYSTGHMFLDLSSPHDACQRRKIKRNIEKTFESLHKSKYIKVKDRPFAEGSRGCNALICLYAQPLSAKERHVILPLMIATFIMQSVAFILCHHKFVWRSIFSYTKWSHF